MREFPFLALWLDDLRDRVRGIFVEFVFDRGDPQPGDQRTDIDMRLAQVLLRAFPDPDTDCFHWFARGVLRGCKSGT